MVHLQVIEKKLESGCVNYKREFSHRGIITKNARLALNLTLNDVCADICSISYLSKVENNIVDMNKRIFKKIKVRLSIPDDVAEFSLDNVNYNKVAHAFMNDKIFDYEAVANTYGQIDLVKPANLLSQGNYEDFEEATENMIYECTYFSPIQFNFMLLMISYYYFKMAEFNNARIVLSYQKPIDDCFIVFYAMYIDTICSVYVKNEHDALNNIQKASIVLARNGFYKLARHIETSYLLLIAKRTPKNEMEKLLANRSDLKASDIRYFRSLKYYYSLDKRKNFLLDDIKYYLLDITENSSDDEIILNTLLLEKLNDVNKVTKLCNSIYTLNSNLKKLLMYLQLKHTKSGTDFAQEVRDLLNNGDLFAQDNLVLTFIMEDITAKFTGLHCYKEALTYYYKLNSFAKKIACID